MKMIDFPELEEITNEYNEEYIIDLYKAIGWKNKTEELDPKLIEINEIQWLDICSKFNALEGFGSIPGYVWMNVGPTCSNGVPYGKVKIKKGAFEEIKKA